MPNTSITRSFANKTIFITGAAKGQGRAVTLAFAKEGANIIAFDLSQKIDYPRYNRTTAHDLETLKEEVEYLGAKILTQTGDVRNAMDVETAVKNGASTFGTIDILFNNAGISAYGYSHELSENEWDSMIDITLDRSRGCCPLSTFFSRRRRPLYYG